jgi:hypothetical protein
VIDAFALMGDIGGMAEKMQSFFLQEVLSQTHIVLKEMLEEVSDLISSHILAVLLAICTFALLITWHAVFIRGYYGYL